MGLIDYMSRNPVRLPIPTSEYDDELVVASINIFLNNLEIIDNVILNKLPNQYRAPYDLIKKRAENKGLLDASSNAQATTKHSKHSDSGQSLPKSKIQSNSNSVHKQSTLAHSKIFNCGKTSINAINLKTMSRKETKDFSGGFIPAELKTNKPRGRTEISLDWQNTSDREESLSDPRWYKRPPIKGKQMNNTKSLTPSTSTASVADTRELIPRSKQSNFPKIIFGGSPTSKTTVVERRVREQINRKRKQPGRLHPHKQRTTQAETETAKSTTATNRKRGN